MAQKHEEILNRLSPEAVSALISAQPSSYERIELPDRTLIEIMDELAVHHLIHGRFLTMPGEVVREYAIARKLDDLG